MTKKRLEGFCPYSYPSGESSPELGTGHARASSLKSTVPSNTIHPTSAWGILVLPEKCVTQEGMTEGNSTSVFRCDVSCEDWKYVSPYHTAD